MTVARSGRLLLAFPRRDPLATPLPALPIPEMASVGPVEIGRCEDGTPWRLKVHGTHVLGISRRSSALDHCGSG